METIQLQQGVPSRRSITLYEDAAGVTPLDLTDKTVFISVKPLNDFTLDDDSAVITSAITVHTTPLSGETLWQLTAEETLIKAGKYKADIRVYVNAADFSNTDTFYIDVIPVVTQRLT